MIIERKVDLSVYYFLKDLFSATPFITVVDSFPMENLTLPTIAVELDTIDTNLYELGSEDRDRVSTWYIDVFANNKAQRDEYGYKILEALESDIPVYDYDEGFPPSVTPSRLGCVKSEDISMKIIKVYPELSEKLYYRSVISFTGRFHQS